MKEIEQIVKCKGPCHGFYHISCANKLNTDEDPTNSQSKNKKRSKPKKLFTEESSETQKEVTSEAKDTPESPEKDWKCKDCTQGENPCFVCNSRSGSRQKCCVGYCGKFYHQKCLKYYPQTVYNQGAPIKKQHLQQNEIVASGDSPNHQILSCPRHVCHTCSSDNPNVRNSKFLYDKLVRCLLCPSTYHYGNYCVPAGSRVSKKFILKKYF